jgi:1,4-dihydroxy-2-naphthoyl-CoA hydrolase
MTKVHEPNPSWNFGLRAQFGHLPVGETGEAPPEISAGLPKGCLLEVFGIRLLRVGPGAALAEMAMMSVHMNQRGIAQAGAIVALADAAAGWATLPALAEGMHFTTLELKINLLRASQVSDVLHAIVTPVHVGGSTIVLDVLVQKQDEARSVVAKFSCTQLVLKPRAPKQKI